MHKRIQRRGLLLLRDAVPRSVKPVSPTWRASFGSFFASAPGEWNVLLVGFKTRVLWSIEEVRPVIGTGGTTSSNVTLDQLVALNDEMAALVRAGVPLETGLRQMAREGPNRLSQMANVLADGLGRGQTLDQVIHEHEELFPPVWRSVVKAGIRSGHLAGALEAMATTGRRLAEMRKVTGLAWLYPIVLMTIAYLFFLMFASIVGPTIARAYYSLLGPGDPVGEAIVRLYQTIPYWWWIPPVLLVAIIIAWFWRNRPVRLLSRDSGDWRRRWVPWSTMRRALYEGRLASFAEVLALLVDQNVPLPEALVLAAEASGDRPLRDSMTRLGESVASGSLPEQRKDLPKTLPPLIGWLLATSARQPALSRALRFVAETYRERATRAIAFNAVYLPIFLSATVGGVVTLAHGLVVFGPVWRLLFKLA